MAIKILFWLLLSLLVSIKAEAQESAAISESDYFVDLSQIVSATRLPQRAEEAPVSITIIDRKMIERSSAIEIVDLLRLVPGMRVAHASGNLFSATYHGYASAWPNRMQVLIDGRSVFTPLFSIIAWNNIGLTINDIERIEVIRGSNSAAYGANAVLGTINIITRKPFQVEGHTLAFTGGAIGTRKSLYRFANLYEKYEQRLTLYSNRDDGFEDVDDYKKIASLSYRGIYTPSYNETLDIQLGFGGGPEGGWGVPGNIENPVRERETRSHYESIKWLRTLAGGQRQEWSLTNNFLSYDDGYVVDLSPFSVPDTVSYSLYSGNATRTEAEFQQTSTSDKKQRFVWGGSYKVDRLKNSIILNRSDYIDVNSQRLFAHIEKYLSDTTILNIGVMAENNGLVGLYSSPRLSLNHAFSDNHSARISAARAKRTPSLYEFYNDNIARLDTILISGSDIFDIRYKSDPNLKEETLTSYELAYIGHFFSRSLDIDAKLYFERLDDIIRNVRDNGTYPDLFDNQTWIWMNTGYTINKGAEIQLKYRANNGWSLDAQYDYSRFTGTIMRSIVPYLLYEDSKIERFSPNHSYSLLLSKQFLERWQASAGYYHTGYMEWLGGGVPGDVGRTDIKLTRSFDNNSTSGKISLIAQNIFDDYYEFEDYTSADHIANVFETRVYCQLEISF